MPRWSSTVAAAFAAAIFLCAPAGARVPIDAQDRDDDCGIPAVKTLLRMGGFDVSEATLLAHLPRARSKKAGLSALDLRTMVNAIGLGVQLDGAFKPGHEVVEEVKRGPVLVLLYEFGQRSSDGTPALGHFAVLEAWSETRGFLMADPALGKRGFISAHQLTAKAHRRSRGGRDEILLMSLNRDKQSIAHALPVTPHEERRFRTIAELRRLATGLPKGKAVITLSVGIDSSHASGGETEPMSLRTTSKSAALTVEYGLSSRSVLTWSSGFGGGSAVLELPDSGRFNLGGSSTLTPMQISVAQRVDLGLPENVTVDVFGGAIFKKFIEPIALQGGISAQMQLGRSAVFGSFDLSVLRENGRVRPQFAPTLGVARDLGGGFSVAADVGVILMPGEPTHARWTLTARRALGRNWAVTTYYSRGLFEPAGAASNQLGFSVSFAVPNRLR